MNFVEINIPGNGTELINLDKVSMITNNSDGKCRIYYMFDQYNIDVLDDPNEEIYNMLKNKVLNSGK